MANGDFILRIQAHYNQFTKTEKKVADYILQNQNKVLFMSITDLADACKVGDTSVFRFCKTMRVKGYQEFKMQLSLSMNGLEEAGKGAEDQDDFTAMAQEVLQSNISAITETNSLLRPHEFEKAMEYLLAASHIYFFGVGASMLTAMEGMNKFLRITPNAYCIMDSHMQAMAASMLSPQDTAIVISYSGSTKDTVEVAELLHGTGAKVICITRFTKSPLTAYADVVMLCGSNEDPLQGGSTSAKMSQLYLLDLLYTEFYRRSYEASASNNQRTSGSVLKRLY